MTQTNLETPAARLAAPTGITDNAALLRGHAAGQAIHLLRRRPGTLATMRVAVPGFRFH